MRTLLFAFLVWAAVAAPGHGAAFHANATLATLDGVYARVVDTETLLKDE